MCPMFIFLINLLIVIPMLLKKSIYCDRLLWSVCLSYRPTKPLDIFWRRVVYDITTCNVKFRVKIHEYSVIDMQLLDSRSLIQLACTPYIFASSTKSLSQRSKAKGTDFLVADMQWFDSLSLVQLASTFFSPTHPRNQDKMNQDYKGHIY